ncbi:MAG: hypothetical protein KF773_28565 [Deltaproteobacteria bacterium]|nr:hypothetical protein [Deltaproteobacteria bacterium]
MKTIVVTTALAATAACWKGPAKDPAPPAREQPPYVELVAIQMSTITFLASSPGGGLGTTRTVEAPVMISGYRWLGRDLGVIGGDENGVDSVGLVTQQGYQAIPMPPATAWPDLQKPDLDHFDTPSWNLTSTASGELWLGRCEWGYDADRRTCTEWAYAKMWPTGDRPRIVIQPPPVQRPDAYKLVPAPAPAGIRTELVRIEAGGEPGDEQGDAVARHFLRCTQKGHTTEYPARDDRDIETGFVDMGEVVWLATDPPMFRAPRSDTCLDVCTTEITFEGCTPSKRFESSQLVPGPGGAYALVVAKRTSVRWRGEEIGALHEHVTWVDFVPPP